MTNQEKFNEAVDNNNSIDIKKFADKKNVDLSHSNNFALLRACLTGNKEIFKFLIDKIPKVSFNSFIDAVSNADFNRHHTILNDLLKYWNIEISFFEDMDILHTKILKNKQVELNEKDIVILVLSLQRGFKDLMTLYLNYNSADILFLFVAIRSNYIDIAKKIMKCKKIDIEYEDNSALYLACRYNVIEIFELLIEDQKIDLSKNDYLEVASRYGNLYIVVKLLKTNKINPSANNSHCLYIAAKEGHIDIVKVLLKDPRVNSKKSLALSHSIYNNHIDITELLLKDKNIDVTESDHYAIKYAMHKNNSFLISILFKHKLVRDYLYENHIHIYDKYNKTYLKEEINNF
jgi:ankyrin repeat protein